MSGKEIDFDVKGQPATGYLSLPQGSDAPGVLVLHAWWGLNPIFKNVCDRLAAEGFAAFAPDINSGRVAKTIEEAKQTIEELDGQRKYDVVMAAADFLRDQPGVRKEPLSVIGFSMGAAWALVLAEVRPQDIRKVVMFYGAGGGDYSKMKVDMLGHFVEKDEWEDEEYIQAMNKDMQAAGLKTEVHFYPNVKHWFFESDRPEFNAEAAELAWKRTVEFLRK